MLTFEESYIRSFVAAAAAAAAVAFVVVVVALRRRPRFRPWAMGALGGVALAASWTVAHQIMRGAVPVPKWSPETIGRAVWPPDVTRRFPAIVAVACGAGALADRASGPVRGAVIVAAMTGIAWVLTEALRRTGTSAAGALLIGAFGGLGMAGVWWGASRCAARRRAMSWAARAAILTACVGVVLMIAGAYSLGLVYLAGTGPILILGIGGRRSADLSRGGAPAAVVASAVGVGAMGAWLAGGWIGAGAIAVAVAACGAVEIRDAGIVRR